MIGARTAKSALAVALSGKKRTDGTGANVQYAARPAMINK